MFRLSAAPLDPDALKGALAQPASGACVTFEGWVRDHNEGRAVTRLEYEAYETLALSEGRKILEEARVRFALQGIDCVHRIGRLEIGDCAVWVGATSSHRAEAFAACRFVIDEIKHRLPIWKKEFYPEGDSGWVNCTRCAEHALAHPRSNPTEYYARQMALPEVGPGGQARLRQASVLVVGAGGLGCSALQYLAAAGIGTLGICDDDHVDISNLHRQTLFAAREAGQPKVLRAAERLRALNPHITVQPHERRLDASTAQTLLPQYDLVLDCTDNFETKFLLNDACLRHALPLIQASIYQFEGQLFLMDPGAGTPCLRCVWPEMPAPNCVRSCADAGVLGAVPGILGAMQAMEALKFLLRLDGQLRGEMLFFDLLSWRTRKVRVARRADCPLCSSTAVRCNTPPPQVEIHADLDDPATQERYCIVDIRDRVESDEHLLNPVAHFRMPASSFDIAALPGDRETRYLFCCARGLRSRYLALHLRELGYPHAYSLRGGLRGQRQPADARR